MIAQYGIDKDKIFPVSEIFKKAGNDVHLADGSQIAGIQGIEMQIQFFPVVDDSLHLVGKVETPEIPVFAMGRENCRRKGANLIAHIRKDGDGDGEGCPSVADKSCMAAIFFIGVLFRGITVPVIGALVFISIRSGCKQTV